MASANTRLAQWGLTSLIGKHPIIYEEQKKHNIDTHTDN